MFEFTRDTTDYTIKFVNQGDDDLLVCEYMNGSQVKYRSMLDTYELINKSGQHYNNESSFLEFFLADLNKWLDKNHSDGDAGSDDPKERLTALIINKLSFNGKHVLLN